MCPFPAFTTMPLESLNPRSHVLPNLVTCPMGPSAGTPPRARAPPHTFPLRRVGYRSRVPSLLPKLRRSPRCHIPVFIITPHLHRSGRYSRTPPYHSPTNPALASLQTSPVICFLAANDFWLSLISSSSLPFSLSQRKRQRVLEAAAATPPPP